MGQCPTGYDALSPELAQSLATKSVKFQGYMYDAPFLLYRDGYVSHSPVCMSSHDGAVVAWCQELDIIVRGDVDRLWERENVVCVSNRRGQPLIDLEAVSRAFHSDLEDLWIEARALKETSLLTRSCTSNQKTPQLVAQLGKL